jgi:F0F1-type ATP synthase assembly protein I
MLYRKKERKKKRFQRIGSTKQNENEECQYRNSGKSLQHNLTKQDPPAERKTNEKRKKKKESIKVGLDVIRTKFPFFF